MPQGPLSPLATLIETLKRENRPATQQEKDFIAAELAKSVPKPSDITAPPAGAPASSPTTWQQIVDNALSPTVVASPAKKMVRAVARPVWNALNYINPANAQQQIDEGLAGLESRDAWQAKDIPFADGQASLSLPVPSTKGYEAGSQLMEGGMNAALLPLAAANPAAALRSVPLMLAADRFVGAATNDLGLDPAKTRFFYDLINTGLMGHGLFKGGAYRPPQERAPFNNLDMREVVNAQTNDGGSFDVRAGKPTQFDVGDAAGSLGTHKTQMINPDRPFTLGELATFVDSHQSELSKPGRVLGVYPGKNGYYAEVSQTYRGPDAEWQAIKDAMKAPIKQESVYVKGKNGPLFPEVPDPSVQRPQNNAGAVAEAFMKSIGKRYETPKPQMPVKVTRAQDIAKFYDEAVSDPNDPAVKSAYSDFGNEVQQQWDFIKQQGYTLEPWTKEGQPYKNSAEMRADIEQNKHLFFFQGGETHPMLGAKDASGLSLNDKFRAVHDFFGHANGEYGFGAKGEEAAWNAHSQMFSPNARRAMTSETRGQNSWVNFGPKGEANRANPANTTYAQQKAVLLPDKYVFDSMGDRLLYGYDKGSIDLSSLFGEPQKVEIGRKAKDGRYKGINPATGRTIDIGQNLVNEASNIADRSNVIVRNVPEEWRPRLEEAGIYEGRPVDGLPFNKVFVPGAEGLDVSGESAKRANLLADFGKQEVGAEWHDSPTFFNLMNDIAAPGKDPRALAARLFGALSPKVGLGENLTTMLEIANKAKMLGKNPDKWTKADWKYVTSPVTNNRGSKLSNVRRAFMDEPLSSYSNDSFSKVGKTEHLAQLMLGNPLGEPFDIHNMRSLGLGSDATMLNAASYDAAAQATARMARAHGMEPAVHMSNRWAGMKRLTNTEGSRSPEQMLTDAGITDVPGTKSFARQLAAGVWDQQGQLIKGLALPVAAAAVYQLLPDDLKEKLKSQGPAALGMTFFVKPGVTGKGYDTHGTASATGRVPDVGRRKAATAVNMSKLKEWLDLHNVAPDVQERIGMIAAQYPRVMAHLTDVANEQFQFGVAPKDQTLGAFITSDNANKRGVLSLNFQVKGSGSPLSEVFAHELQHAGQNIFTKSFASKYAAEDKAKGYVKNKYEVAARRGAAKRELEAQIMQLHDNGGMVKAASKDPLSSAIKGTAVPSQSVTPPGQKMAALSPKRIAEILEITKADTKGLPSQENMATLETMLKRPDASVFDPNSEYPRLNAKDEPKFILPSGHVIAGPIGIIHTKFAGQKAGDFNRIMEGGSHRISYDKAEADIGQGLETWTPFGWRAADSIAQLHEAAAFGIRPSKPESIATLVDVHKAGDASKPLAYRYTDYLGGKSIYDLTADKLRAFADALFAKAKK